MLMASAASFTQAARLAAGTLSLGEAFAFMSTLYFRGKLAYAQHFSESPQHVRVITPSRGLQPPAAVVTRDMLVEFAGVDLATAGERYLGPLRDDARALQAQLAPEARVVLLGSIATAKYLKPLSDVFGDRLCYPGSFVGRGDMSRGGLLLRSVVDDCELDYVPFTADAVRRGSRPPRLEPRKGILLAVESRRE